MAPRVSRLLLASFVALGACGPADPPPKAAAPPPPPDPTPTSAEWIYATEGTQSGTRAECKAVVERLEDEAGCKGALCSHAATLASDWLRTCKKLTPDLVGRVEAHAASLEKKAKLAPSQCEDEVLGLLRDGCEKRENCGAFAQAWVTQCNEWSTPLVSRMIEVAVERKTGERMHLDTRSCSQLLAEVQKGRACEQQFKCQDFLPAIETWRGRCVSESQPPALSAAVVELSIRVGATEQPKPMPISATSPKVDATNARLALDDGSGAVLMVCGKRAKDVDDYLAQRKACTDGEIVMARRFEDKNGPVVRVGRIPHPSDKRFRERFPALVLDDEYRARFEAAVPAFISGVDEAIRLAQDPKKKKEAITALVAVMSQNRDAVSTSSTFEDAIVKKDEALAPLFHLIGDAKRAAFSPDLPERKLVPAVNRALSLVFADIGVDGRVKIGDSSPASSLDLGEMLPRATAAYLEALASRIRLAQKSKMARKDLDKLGTKADTEIGQCTAAANRYESSEQALIACAFGVESCDAARLTSLGEAVDQAAQDLSRNWPSTTLAVESLGEDLSPAVWKAAKLAGCREPWW